MRTKIAVVKIQPIWSTTKQNNLIQLKGGFFKMRNLLNNKKGFTLIELMIVVAIIGVLAAIAIPNFLNYQCKAKQAEAKTNLGNIRTAQEAFRAENDTYTTSLTAIGFSASGDTRYAISITAASANSFTAQADGTAGDVSGDVWTMTENGTLTNGTNACQ